jgi:uncharacterized protein YndB with AHSA1/START domain
MQISLSTNIKAQIERVWAAWTTPEDITQWNFASSEWCCPRAELDLSPGGAFVYRMEAKDGSMGFDFEGTFTEVEPMKLIKFKLGDDREVSVSFSKSDGGTVIVEETFEAEDEHSAEQQRQGWQAILENFRVHAEASDT